LAQRDQLNRVWRKKFCCRFLQPYFRKPRNKMGTLEPMGIFEVQSRMLGVVETASAF
jgi:hypothetical protein